MRQRCFLRLVSRPDPTLHRMASHPIELVMLTYFTLLAAQLGAGSVSSFNFASDYQVVPILLIGAPFSLAVFPTLSAAFAVRAIVAGAVMTGRVMKRCEASRSALLSARAERRGLIW